MWGGGFARKLEEISGNKSQYTNNTFNIASINTILWLKHCNRLGEMDLHHTGTRHRWDKTVLFNSKVCSFSWIVVPM